MKTIFRATLCNSAGELDYFTADSIEDLQRQLGKRLLEVSGWLLADGDTIIISSGQPKNVEKRYGDSLVTGTVPAAED